MQCSLIRSELGSEYRQGLEREKSNGVRLLCLSVFDRAEERFFYLDNADTQVSEQCLCVSSLHIKFLLLAVELCCLFGALSELLLLDGTVVF